MLIPGHPMADLQDLSLQLYIVLTVISSVRPNVMSHCVCTQSWKSYEEVEETFLQWNPVIALVLSLDITVLSQFSDIWKVGDVFRKRSSDRDQ